MKAALREAGCRITRQRTAIIELLVGRTDHPSARQIHRALQGRAPGPSLATVYNTLGTLVGLGLIHEMEFGSHDNRYDPNTAPHINLVCTACGRIDDYDHGPPISPAQLERTLGFVTTGCRLDYRGLCAACRTRPESTSGR
jgi:Fe2+ or Zn2+ uptake regulation protein